MKVLSRETEPLYMVIIPASWVENYHRYARTHGEHPTYKIPVDADHDAIVSTYRFADAEEITAGGERLCGVFLSRPSRRQVRATGRWAPAKKSAPARPKRTETDEAIDEAPVSEDTIPDDAIAISTGYVSREAVYALAMRLKCKPEARGEFAVVIRDERNLGADWFKKALVREEKLIRKRRLAYKRMTA